MAFDWQSFALSDAGRIVTGKTPPSALPGQFGKDIPFVTPSDMDGRKWIHTTTRFLSRAGVESIKNAVVPARSVLVSCIGSDMGKASLTTRPCATNQQINTVVVDATKFDAEFLFYNLSLRKIEIRGMASGSAQPILNKSHFSAIRFKAPSIEKQRDVVAPLKALDDKIALLRETNTTLEAIAQALFKSWFVDFDPVRAKTEGRDPEGAPPEAVDLFPSEFQESQLGAIPKGWRVGSVYEVANVVYGAPFSSKGFNTNQIGYPLIRIRDLKTQDPELFTDEIHPKGRLVLPGELIVGMDAEFKPAIWAGPKAWLNQRVCLFEPINGACVDFLLCAIRPMLEYFERAKVGTTVIHLGKGDIDQFRIIVPPSAVLEVFGELSAGLATRRLVNSSQIRSLTELRETLLPRLMSGRLRVPDAQEVQA